jgi:hypothetical protein
MVIRYGDDGSDSSGIVVGSEEILHLPRARNPRAALIQGIRRLRWILQEQAIGFRL